MATANLYVGFTDLAIEVTTLPAEGAAVDELVTTVFKVTNQSKSAAQGVDVRVTTSGLTTAVSPTVVGETLVSCSTNATVASCDNLSLASNEFLSFTVTSTPTVKGTLKHLVTVVGQDSDRTPDDNQVELSTAVVGIDSFILPSSVTATSPADSASLGGPDVGSGRFHRGSS
ncbi:MAG: hypothetical protein ACI9OJ_005478, partial [Myxococcota bacterium]